MLNNFYWYGQYWNSGLLPWISISSAISTADLWPDINAPKYVFIQKDWDNIISQIHLSDFFEREDNLWIHFLNDNLRDLPNKEISTYTRPYWDWGRILNERLTEKAIDIDIRVVAGNYYDLEETLLNLKSVFDYGGQLQINENWHLKYIDVVLENFKVNADWGIWNRCDVTVSFLTVTPIKKSWTKSIQKANLTWDYSFNISITWSRRAIIPKFKIVATDVTWVISSVTISYYGFDIKYTWTIITWDYVDFDWERWVCLFNWVESDFDWIIRDIETLQQTPISISFEWAWTIEYSFYMLYNNLSL